MLEKGNIKTSGWYTYPKKFLFIQTHRQIYADSDSHLHSSSDKQALNPDRLRSFVTIFSASTPTGRERAIAQVTKPSVWLTLNWRSVQRCGSAISGRPCGPFRNTQERWCSNVAALSTLLSKARAARRSRLSFGRRKDEIHLTSSGVTNPARPASEKGDIARVSTKHLNRSRKRFQVKFRVSFYTK